MLIRETPMCCPLSSFCVLMPCQMPKPCFLCGIKGHNARDCENQQCFKVSLLSFAWFHQSYSILDLLTVSEARSQDLGLSLPSVQGRHLLQVNRFPPSTASEQERRCGSIQHSPYDCPDAIRCDGIIKMPLRSQRVDPLLSTAWSGIPPDTPR